MDSSGENKPNEKENNNYKIFIDNIKRISEKRA